MNYAARCGYPAVADDIRADALQAAATERTIMPDDWTPTTPAMHYEDETVQLWRGDCLEVLRSLPDNSVDSVVTDPPYGLEFMGKDWDAPWKSEDKGVHAEARTRRAGEMVDENKRRFIASAVNKFAAGRPFQDWCLEWAAECLRVLKPGGHMLAFGGTRTWHRLACAVEDAGFEVRDSIAWLYGSGFPKSLDVSKAIDKAAGAEREVVGQTTHPDGRPRNLVPRNLGVHEGGQRLNGVGLDITAPATPDAERWQGWGTALKPAFEPIIVARKPLAGTVAQTVLAHGTGALNIDGTRVGETVETWPKSRSWNGWGAALRGDEKGDTQQTGEAPAGRWPTNVLLDDSQAEVLDEQSGESSSKSGGASGTHFSAGEPGVPTPDRPRGGHNDTGGASRFFPTFRYEAKAPSSERPRYKREGGSDNATTYGQMKTRECNVCRSRAKAAGGDQSGKPWPTCGHDDWSWVEQQSARDEFVAHPTVKPLTLMSWLVRLVTPPGGTVLEPFAGSGTTVEAAIVEGFRCVAIEREADYLPLIMQRINRRRDPVQALRQTGQDLGLFEDPA